MLQSVLQQFTSIRQLLQDRDQLHRLDGIYQDQLSHLIEFRTLFKLAITELQGEEYPTIHLVMLWFAKLKKHCKIKFGDPPYIRVLRVRASNLLNEKLSITPTHKIATFLCPRFKSLKMLSLPDHARSLNTQGSGTFAIYCVVTTRGHYTTTNTLASFLCVRIGSIYPALIINF